MKKNLILFFCLIIFLSCKTVPIPESESDSMAVLLTEFIKETDISQFGTYTFQITKEDSNYKEYISFRTNRTIFLKNLEPGLYNVTYSFLYKSGKRGSKNDLFSFAIEKGKAMIIDEKIIIKIYEKEKDHAFMTRYSEKVSDKAMIINDLINQYPELSSWDWISE